MAPVSAPLRRRSTDRTLRDAERRSWITTTARGVLYALVVGGLASWPILEVRQDARRIADYERCTEARRDRFVQGELSWLAALNRAQRRYNAKQTDFRKYLSERDAAFQVRDKLVRAAAKARCGTEFLPATPTPKPSVKPSAKGRRST